jgi:2-C-methyl-D-erythritol 2,4-cyclodiphosphate synthase
MNSDERPITRIGLGTDLHRLESPGPLRIGGIDIPFDRHSAGHSDADVVLHAIIDALLGACGLPDIGERFPDTDPAYKGCDSRKLLQQVLADVRGRGLAVQQVDLVIHAERPKLAGHKEAIQQSLAGLLGLPLDRVGVKAKTGEGLDAVGRGEAIACTAIVGLIAARQ